MVGSKKVVRVRWGKPQAGWCCLSTDGFASASSGRAGCGGLIRDEQGEWVGGFPRRLGCLDSFIAELWGLRNGPMLCKNMNLNAVSVQLDAMSIVQLLTSPTITNLPVLPLINDCRQLISQIAQVRIVRCFCEANSCTDCLARIGSVQERPFLLYQDLPVDLLELLCSDRFGLYVNKTVADSPFPP